MVSAQVIDSVSQVNFDLGDVPIVPLPKAMIMTSPDHFDVTYAINPHMDGHVGGVDKDLAMAQWKHLWDTYRELGFEMELMPGAEEHPDIVFVANHGLPYFDEQGSLRFLLSNMRFDERKGEVAHFKRFVESKGFGTDELPESFSFEGMGDMHWHPKRRLLWGAYGPRTDKAVFDEVSRITNSPLVRLKLVSEDFYHLDVALCPIDETTALYYPAAFDEESVALIRHFFEDAIELSYEDAMGFAGNAYCHDRKHVAIQKGCTQAMADLESRGFVPVPIDLSEFIKAGGNATCLRLPVL
jgi:N-dimethylarginine dimethylaminohydrolase